MCRSARVVTVLGVVLVTVLSSTAAFANAASPKASPLTTGIGRLQRQRHRHRHRHRARGCGHFGTESATTAGLAATVNHPCDTRTGVGWGVVWNDPNDPGFAETYMTKHGTLVTADGPRRVTGQEPAQR